MRQKIIIVFYLHPWIKGNFSSVWRKREPFLSWKNMGTLTILLLELLTCTKQVEVAVLVATSISVQNLSKNKGTHKKTHVGNATDWRVPKEAGVYTQDKILISLSMTRCSQVTSKVIRSKMSSLVLQTPKIHLVSRLCAQQVPDAEGAWPGCPTPGWAQLSPAELREPPPGICERPRLPGWAQASSGTGFPAQRAHKGGTQQPVL